MFASRAEVAVGMLTEPNFNQENIDKTATKIINKKVKAKLETLLRKFPEYKRTLSGDIKKTNPEELLEAVDGTLWKLHPSGYSGHDTDTVTDWHDSRPRINRDFYIEHLRQYENKTQVSDGLKTRGEIFSKGDSLIHDAAKGLNIPAENVYQATKRFLAEMPDKRQLS